MKGAPAYGFLGNDVEPDLHLIEPRRVGGCEVNVVARVGREPAFDLVMFVGAVIVDDEMDIEIGRDIVLDVPEELEKFLMAMMPFALAQDLARYDVQGSEKSGGAVSEVVVRDAFDISKPDRQDWLSSFQGLDLAFLIDAEDQGLIRWVEVQAGDIPNLFHKERIGREGEMFLSMRLQAKGLPETMNGRFGDFCFLGQRSTAPVGPVSRFAFEGRPDQLGNPLVFNGARTSRFGFVIKTHDSLVQEAFAPDADHGSGEAHFLGDVCSAESISGHEDNLGSSHQAVGEGSRLAEGLDLRSGLRAQDHGGNRTTKCHRLLLLLIEEPTTRRLYSTVIHGTIH